MKILFNNWQMLKRSIGLVLIIISVFTLFPASAYAYLDPGSGSFIIQVVIASIAGAGFFFRSQIGKFLGIFKRKESSESDEKDD